MGVLIPLIVWFWSEDDVLQDIDSRGLEVNSSSLSGFVFLIWNGDFATFLIHQLSSLKDCMQQWYFNASSSF